MHDRPRLRERVEFIHDQTHSDALVEEYVDGREIYVGVIGNERLTTLPLWEIDFGTLSGVTAGIATCPRASGRASRGWHDASTRPCASPDMPGSTCA